MVRALRAWIGRQQITPAEAGQILDLHWEELPPAAQVWLASVDVNEVLDGVTWDVAIAAWEDAPLDVRRCLSRPWLILGLGNWLETAFRTPQEHMQVRAHHRAYGVELGPDEEQRRWGRSTRRSGASVAPKARPRDARSPRVRARARERRRSRAPPADDEADPETDDVDRAWRGWSS